MLFIVALFITAACLVITVITISNVITFPRLIANEIDGNGAQPSVSILIPARDEADTISESIQRLLAQDYPDFEIMLLDDGSSDGTSDIARAAADGAARLTIVPGQPVSPGWVGKNWACHQLVQRASHDVFVFTDADVRWEPGALGSTIQLMERAHADLLAIWPTQETRTWGERLCVPLMAFAVLSYLPVIGVHFTRFPTLAAANGQCMIWRRAAYSAVGGHESVKDNVLEDVTLARKIKSQQLRLRMVDGNRLIGCRMYRDWPSVRDGFAKNILAGYGGNVTILALATGFHWLLFLFPWLWLLTGWETDALAAWPVWPLALIATGTGIRALTAAFTHQRTGDALLMPVSVLLMTRIAMQSIWWQMRYGGPIWKGRTVGQNQATRNGIRG
jgi:chlorobactene glucosyltransferase